MPASRKVTPPSLSSAQEMQRPRGILSPARSCNLRLRGGRGLNATLSRRDLMNWYDTDYSCGHWKSWDGGGRTRRRKRRMKMRFGSCWTCWMSVCSIYKSFGDLTPAFRTSLIVFIPRLACFDFFLPSTHTSNPSTAYSGLISKPSFTTSSISTGTISSFSTISSMSTTTATSKLSAPTTNSNRPAPTKSNSNPNLDRLATASNAGLLVHMQTTSVSLLVRPATSMGLPSASAGV
ncbi:hypothetical protein JAAARDRAFT_490396 [Jaapia argillacea MUCL 33604]|uniref:Uncharacterized protein n=1 Tax=Jaapia argillacea MUCL 33604 TaxID=933084 RepID=A0A067PE64_9AGAM|nr:hypothetical protein JAAARDRAFT_490396 [Jaapia argillacea MUCL 33604]